VPRMFDGIKQFVICACPHYILDACCFHIVLIAECDQECDLTQYSNASRVSIKAPHNRSCSSNNPLGFLIQSKDFT
jgi:hypothetical protein